MSGKDDENSSMGKFHEGVGIAEPPLVSVVFAVMVRGRPVNPVEGIPTALGANLPVECEARATALALIGVSFVVPAA